MQKRVLNIFNESAKKLKSVSSADCDKIFEILQSRIGGLTDDEVEERQDEFGKNEVRHEKAPSWIIQFLSAFVDPFIGILVIIAIVSLVLNDYQTVIIVGVMIMISVLLRFFQEFRSSRAAEQLKTMVQTTAAIQREGTPKKEIDIKDIVPGDVVYLSAGDMIPADCRLIQSKDMFVVQSTLTGESLPVEKKGITIDDVESLSPLELENICFMGTNVVSGTAVAVAVNTGSRTYIGSLSKSLSGKRAETTFDKGIKKVSYLLITFMMLMVPVVFLINGLAKHNWTDALLFAVAIAVGLTPAMLPMIVTVNLAKGAVNMSKRKVIVKRLNSIQNIGAMDVLCTDKTGTLTLDKVVLERYLNTHGDSDDEVLKWAYLNSYHQTGLKSLLDLAVLNHVELQNSLQVSESFTKVDEIPFDFQRRRMSVILKEANGKHILICKGAVEEMLNLCAVNDDKRQRTLNLAKELNQEGLRVLAVAIKEFEPRDLTYSVDDEKDMKIKGLIGFLDPAKPSAKSAIEALQKLGVTVKVLTGDNDIVTKKVCRDVGIPYTNILLGNDLDNMDDDALRKQIPDVAIFAKLSPMQKARVVKLLQSMGHSVGFMGDGINDTAALRDADVGISVDTAVDVAKENADIILLENDLMVLRKGVIYGRRTFGNIIKYIKMAVSSNFGNMFSMLGASIFIPFLPMLPIQILLQNLLYDISQTAIPWDKMDEEFIAKPKVWDASDISRFMCIMGPVSSIFDYVLFAVMWFVFKANTPEHQCLFQTGWFVEGLLTQTLIVHVIRTRKVPFIQSWATAPLTAMTSLIMVIGIILPFTPFAAGLKMMPLPLSYFPILICILFGYCLLSQLVKVLYIKKFNQWL